MVTRIILTLALATLAFSGCLGASDAIESENMAPPQTDPAAREAVSAVDVPACTSHRVNSNYGLSIWLGNTVYSWGGEDGQQTYVEDNGMAGLQTEKTCPGNPDTRLA